MPVSLIFQALLQFAGVTMIVLALAHFGLSKLLAWQEDTRKLTPINRQVFIVHTVFLAVGIFLLGLVCLFFAAAFFEKTTLATVATGSFATVRECMQKIGWRSVEDGLLKSGKIEFKCEGNN